MEEKYYGIEVCKSGEERCEFINKRALQRTANLIS